MSQTIYKYPLTVTDHPVIQMPRGAIPLTVQTQYGEPQVWALVDPLAPLESVHFSVYGTGHIVEDPASLYLGTFQMHDGGLVFHVFRRLRATGGPS